MSSEVLFKDMADRLVADGYKDAGYTFVNIDVSESNAPVSFYKDMSGFHIMDV